MQLLRGAIRTYAWGSRTAIAEFTGRPVPTAHPEAELWLGANPGDPAWLEEPQGEVSLLQALVADPDGQLGPAARARFGDALPFLVKVLAADEPLSLQAHPSAEQAAEGWAQISRDLAAQTYRLYVLDEFTYPMKWGWVDVDEVVSVLAARPGDQHVVITGRDADPRLVGCADLVTEMTKVKHPMEAGQKGQKGIEW